MGESIEVGVVGLGCIGGGLALQALRKGMHVVAYDPAGGSEELLSAGIDLLEKPTQFHQHLQSPRMILLSLPALKMVDQVLAQLTPGLAPGDVVIDCGNSYWGDSIRRYRKCRDEFGIHFVDCGTSGGAPGARHGACFMVGGTAEAYALAAPLLDRLAVPGGLVHCGSPGSGHYTKLIHNGIEYGIMQAIGEGLHMLEEFREELPVEDILETWNHGSMIRSWLMERLAEGYREQSANSRVPEHVEDTGEVNWLIEDALRMEVPIPVISQSAMQLFTSRDRPTTWTRAVAMMHQGFAEHGHSVNQASAQYRQNSRVGSWLDKDEPNRGSTH